MSNPVNDGGPMVNWAHDEVTSSPLHDGVFAFLLLEMEGDRDGVSSAQGGVRVMHGVIAVLAVQCLHVEN